MVNAIPERVQLESYVRGRTYDAIVDNNKKINRALIGAALSMGTNIEIIDMPGYSPLNNDVNLIEVAKEAAASVGIEFTVNDNYSSGSTDMGDLSAIMPVIHPYSAGARGSSHGNDYEIVDPEAACVTNAKWQLTMLKILLGNSGERAKKIISEYKAPFKSKEEFLAFQDSLNCSGDRIAYTDDGKAEIKL